MDLFPSLAGKIPPNAAENTISLLCIKGTLMIYVQFGVHQDFLYTVVLQLGSTHHVLVPGVVLPQLQDFVLLV